VQGVLTGGEAQWHIALSTLQHAITYGSNAIFQAPCQIVTTENIAIDCRRSFDIGLIYDKTGHKIRYAGPMRLNVECARDGGNQTRDVIDYD